MTVLACSPGEFVWLPTPTPVPTRPPAPTFTPTPESLQALVVVTPPHSGTPGVIIVPPGVDPSTLIPIPTATFTPEPPAPPTSTSMSTSTSTFAPPDSPLIPPEGTAELVIASPQPEATTPGLAATELTAEPTTEPMIEPTIERSRPVVQVPGPTSAAPLPTPTETPTPPPTPTPAPTPTPFILVEAGLVSLRSGPSVEYPLVAQLGPDIPVAIVGRNPEGTWLQICCVNGESVWVAEGHVSTQNSTADTFLVLPDIPPPTATATATPEDTPTVTPTPTATPYPFQIAEGPLFFPTNNELLSIWVKVFVPNEGDGQPLPGYFLNVEFRGRSEFASWDSRPNTRGEAPSTDYFDYSAPAGPAGGNRVQFNYKYEFLAPDPRAENPNATETRLTAIDGFWRVYLTDGSGTQLSDYVEFDTMAGNSNREVYVAWAP